MDINNEKKIVFGALTLIILGIFITLGLTGARTVLGLMLIVFLPFYLIFNNFNLSQPEKIAFSSFVSIAVFPSLVYWLGFILPFRISIFAIFTLLIGTAFIIKLIK